MARQIHTPIQRMKQIGSGNPGKIPCNRRRKEADLALFGTSETHYPRAKSRNRKNITDKEMRANSRHSGLICGG